MPDKQVSDWGQILIIDFKLYGTLVQNVHKIV